MSKENLFEHEDDAIEDFNYDLTPYNFNMDVEGLIRRYKSKDIIIPAFQRNYVWSKESASMFIDSILRGLPIPSFFFFEEAPQKYLVIDGQQRLLTIYYFLKGKYPYKKQHQDLNEDDTTPRYEGEIEGEPFALSGVKIHSAWKGKTFDQLTEDQKKRIQNTYLYIVNLKQTSPDDNNSSMYLVFERINTGSTRLNPQQIRLCISHGKYSKFLCEKALNPEWTNSFGINDKSGTISELILRFISLYYSKGYYKGSMKTFLDKSIKENDNFEIHSETEITKLYEESFYILCNAFTLKDFTPNKTINGYLLLVTWIAVANILPKTKNKEIWVLSNKEEIQKVFSRSCSDNRDVASFIQDTRRASKTETLQNIISIMTNEFDKIG